MKKYSITEQDQLLFQETMQGVKPLLAKSLPLVRSPKKLTRVKQPIFAEPIILTEQLETPVSHEEALFFVRASGLQAATIKRLKQGKVNSAGTLDLHHHTVAEAEQALHYFLTEHLSLGDRYLTIVHGKGYSKLSHYPVLKNQVNVWLRSHPLVLAFASTTPKDGGTGAVYVLLKQVKE